MRRGPPLQRPVSARHPPLAIAQCGEPQDQQRADVAERIAVPASAIGPRLDVDQRIADDDEQAEPARNLGPAKARIAQEAFVAPLAHPLGLGGTRAAAQSLSGEEARHPPASSSSRALDRNSSGDPRIAAPEDGRASGRERGWSWAKRWVG